MIQPKRIVGKMNAMLIDMINTRKKYHAIPLTVIWAQHTLHLLLITDAHISMNIFSQKVPCHIHIGEAYSDKLEKCVIFNSNKKRNIFLPFSLFIYFYFYICIIIYVCRFKCWKCLFFFNKNKALLDER